MRAYWRECLASGTISASDFDPDTYDWEKYGEYFDALSDDEWARVWAHVVAVSTRVPSEVRVRELVNDAALYSGWFAGYSISHISQADLGRYANEKRRALRKVQNFRREMSEFFGPPSSDWKEPYDPWQHWRKILAELDDLAKVLEHRISLDERDIESAKDHDPPSAAKPALDCWRARLLLVWENECGLPTRNSKHVRGFLLEALRPYMPRAELTDRMAKYFIKRWLAGEVERPGPSLGQRLRAPDKLRTS